MDQDTANQEVLSQVVLEDITTVQEPLPLETETPKTRGKRTRAQPAKKTAKRTKEKTLGFYLVCPSGPCAGVIGADSVHSALDILNTVNAMDKDVLVPITLDQEFCYPVSMGKPEQVPQGATATSSNSDLYCVHDFDFVAGYRGLAMVVAQSKDRAIELTDEYLRDRGFKDSIAHPFEAEKVLLEVGYSEI